MTVSRETYTSTFFNLALQLREGIPVDRASTKEKMNKFELDCLREANALLGTDVEFVKTQLETRAYIHEVFGKDTRLLYNEIGEMTLDLEHILMFYHNHVAKGGEFERTARGLVYLVGCRAIKESVSNILKNVFRDVISPIYKTTPTGFTWGRCPDVTRRLFQYLACPEGYVGYRVELNDINLLAFLNYQGKAIPDAKKYLETTTGGMFFNFTDKKLENFLLPYLLSGEFDNLDGYYAATFNEENTKLRAALASYQYTVYTQYVRPIAIELTGMLIYTINEQLKSNPNFSTDLIKFYSISDTSVGLAVKEGVELFNYLPAELKKAITPIGDFTIDKLFTYEYL